MEARIAKLEAFAEDARDRLVRIETRLDAMGATMATKDSVATLATKDSIAGLATKESVAAMATKEGVRADIAGVRADIAEAKTSIIMWVVGAVFIAQLLPAIPAILRAFGLGQ